MESVELYGVRLDSIEESEFNDMINDWLTGNTQHIIFTPNPEFLLIAKSDATFLDILNSADLLLPDGVGLKLASVALLERRLIRRTGTDTLWQLAQNCAKQDKSILLLGGEIERVAQRAGEVLKSRYPSLKVHAINPGSVSDARKLINMINEIKPDVLALALGQKKQEMAIAEILNELPSVRIAIGVGGAFDMISGSLPRAPKMMRQFGFEWLWRLYLEPKRWRRIYRAVIVFPTVVACDTLKQRRFLKACKAVFKELFRI
jgi:N-acetylglucosaminyldiphosphoundecaprenol N-acetyl-beta-D-mannosaminyltransferase